MILRFAYIALSAFFLLGAGCKESKPMANNGRPIVVTTTTMLGDLVRQIAGDVVDARSIMKPGGDPHLYQPTPQDARIIASSSLVVTSGLHLEGWIDDLVRNAGGERPVAVAASRVEPIRMENSPGGVDPHFWFDLGAWALATDEVSEHVVRLVGPDTAEGARVLESTARYRSELDRLDAWTRAQLSSVPREQRVLVTSHDAFNYFGRAYGLEVIGIQGISTESEASMADVSKTADLIRERGIKAIFVESSVNSSAIERIARDTGIRIGGELFSDSVGPAGEMETVGGETYDLGTYLGMMKHNVNTIVEALK